MTTLMYLGCPSSDRHETERALAAGGVSVIWADGVRQVVDKLEHQWLPVLLDLMSGPTMLRHASDIRGQCTTALLFAVVDRRRPDLTAEAILAGVADVFARPIGPRRVVRAIARELGAQDSTLDPGADELYTYSAPMRGVAAAIDRAASTREGVVIRGEDGTGRQVVARTIHAARGPMAAPFVAIDCARQNGDALDVALFGATARATANGQGPEHVSGSSLLASAMGGTLYFQNLADTPTRVQGRLARVLRDREVVLGENGQVVDFDVRPMAGAPADLDAMVADGRLRGDLFRRLSGSTVDMPPLRDRREDIPVLANHFVREASARLHVQPRTLSRPALSLLAALPWRGNAKELKSLVDAVVSVADARGGIGLEDVLAHVRLDGGSVAPSGSGTLRQARARFEREYIETVLDRHRGRISEAAKTLGIQRTNLYRKMRTLHLPVRRYD